MIDAAGARRERGDERRGVQREAFVGVRLHDHRRRVGELDLLDQRRPAGQWVITSSPGAEQHQRRVVERLLAAGGDDDVGRRVLDAVVGRVARGDRPLQLLGAGVGRVLREVGVDGRVRRGVDVRGRREVRLAGAEIDDVDARPPSASSLRRRPSSWVTGAIRPARAASIFHALNVSRASFFSRSRRSTIGGTRPCTDPPSATTSLTRRELT